jgi:hypothetical protein
MNIQQHMVMLVHGKKNLSMGIYAGKKIMVNPGM